MLSLILKAKLLFNRNSILYKEYRFLLSIPLKIKIYLQLTNIGYDEAGQSVKK